MIYVRVTEGLGNQFYKYAHAFAIAQKYHEELTIDIAGYKYDPRKFELDKFNISAKIVCLATPKINNLFYKIIARIKRRMQIDINYYLLEEDKKNYFHYKEEKYPKNKNIYIQGYWQNYKYFSQYRSELCREFTLKNKSAYIIKICESVANECSLAIHMRMGDYKTADRINSQYYKKALNIINKLTPITNIYIFCEKNDIMIAKKIFKGLKAYYVSECYAELSDIETFEIMRHCRNQIISNSTFSWWAAWLNKYKEKKIIAPLIDNLQEDYYPEEWILIEAKHEKEEI